MPPNYAILPKLIKEAMKVVPEYRANRNQVINTAQDALFGRQYDQDLIASRVDHLVNVTDRLLRTGSPTHETMNQQFLLANLPDQVCCIAADSSQIHPSPHAGLQFGLTNAATFSLQVKPDTGELPAINVKTELYIEDLRVTENATLATGEAIDLYRDLREREILAETAIETPGFTVSYLDGQLETWSSRDASLAGLYEISLKKVVAAFSKLQEHNKLFAGYVDTAGSQLLVRLAEIIATPDNDLPGMRVEHPFALATDRDLLDWLKPGYRSAVFKLARARSAFIGEMEIHFFFMNTGTEGHQNIVRIEIPKYVAAQPDWVNILQAVTLQQCRIIPNVYYPYCLIRADEESRISREDQQIAENMIRQAYMAAGLSIPPDSAKSIGKQLT